ncbi:hypothetical protein Pmi06nite_81900 [Planotetraspora mira]|uniref:Uncharacterized protein n=1 Tax=Planotetraspora mira TaxID=58121 RepID=A0A8J3TX96_9ACTN|nr:hypothetical protein Pmi06nite_81900 [Planotetraspora mira]
MVATYDSGFLVTGGPVARSVVAPRQLNPSCLRCRDMQRDPGAVFPVVIGAAVVRAVGTPLLSQAVNGRWYS